MRDLRNWEEKYRPRQFGAVRGQQAAVDQLSNLIRSGKLEKHIVLTGAVGSGKTTLAEVYARALNCANNLHDGSPCDMCAFCKNPKLYFHEIDAAGRTLTNDIVQDLVAGRNARHGLGGTQVVFFDEAHALSRTTQDGLLITLQNARKGLVFVFATTEKKEIIPALLSRCLHIEINELDPAVAFDYLRFLAESENLSFEPAALRLLAAVRPPYARDLVIGLQGLGVLNQLIDADLVKAHYDLGVCDHLARYASALANGDQIGISRSLQLWRETALAKKRWIELFTCSAYYNCVIGSGYVVDRLVDSMRETQSDFVARIRSRLDLDQESLEHFFEGLMHFFAKHGECDDARAYLVIALFGKLVERGEVSYETAKPISSKFGIAPKEALTHHRATHGKEDHINPAPAKSQFLQSTDVRQIVNRASFFVQHYGMPLNAYVTIELCDLKPDLELRSSVFLQKLIDAVEDRPGQRPRGVIATIERDGMRIIARILMLVGCEELPGWQSWIAKQIPNIGGITRFSSCNDARDMTFQWKAVRDMCAGCSPAVEPHNNNVRQHLQISKSKWRVPGPIDQVHLYFSANLSEEAITAATFPEMIPLSPYDRRAFNWIPLGWELKEFLDRTREQERRLALLARMRLEGEHGEDAAQGALQNALQNWRQEGEHRMRHWRGWW